MKLDEKELTVLQGLQSEFNNTKMNLASIELQKYDTLKKLDVLKGHFAEHEEELVKKYGADAVINLQTGEVSEKKD